MTGTQPATAGPRGDSVRSDLHVAFTPGDEALVIELHSRVAPYYGEAIDTQVRNVLATLGVGTGRVAIHDGGALPFVIAARLETAVRRAGLGGESRALPEAHPRPAPSTRDRLRRSRLYLPGSQPKIMVSAGLHGPDAVILDLEDSVHPAEKDAARTLVRNALQTLDFGAAERMVRINQLPLGLEDLDEIVPVAPDLILIPKVEDPSQVRAVDERITAIQERLGETRALWLMPILESALGFEHAFAVAQASPRVAALTLGLEDYTADLGVRKTPEGSESLYARTRTVNAAKAAGVQAIDSVYGDVDDTEGLLAWGRRSRDLGFEGMGCVHPRQIPVVHEAYAPGKEELTRAARIVAAFEAAKAEGRGVVSLGSKMIDPPVVERAVKLMGRARAMGLSVEEA